MGTFVLLFGIFMVSFGLAALYTAGKRIKVAKQMEDKLKETHRAAAMAVQEANAVSEDLRAMKTAFDADVEVLTNILEGEPFFGRWHHGNGVLVSGTVRIAREDFDTQPSDEFRQKFWDRVCSVMNAVIAIEERIRKVNDESVVANAD